jgi:hypothetical protein
MADLFGGSLQMQSREPGDVAGDILAKLGRDLGAKMADPRSRAYGGGFLATAVILSRRHMPFLMYYACCHLGGFAARKAWDLAEDVHAIAQQSREVDPGGIQDSASAAGT